MRKLLVFALVFGLGLAALLLSVRWRGQQRQRAVPVTPIEGTPEEQRGDAMVPIPSDDESAEPGDQGFVQFDGRVEFTGFDPEDPEALPTFHVIAGDVDHLQANEHELKDIVLDFFDAETGAIRATLKAKRGRAHMRPLAIQPHFEQNKATRLWDVEFTLLSDAPFVPLTVFVPVVDVDVDARTFTSESNVELRGRGMTAESRGLFIDENEGLVRLVREGSIDLWVDDETRIQLDATGDGPIELSRVLQGSDELLRVEGRGGALLVVEGDESLSSTSDTLVIRGRRDLRAPGGQFVPLGADASGGVVLRRGSDRFEGRTGEIEFQPDGQPKKATLEGDPQGWAWVDAALDENEPGERVQIELSGLGPLVAEFHPETRFEMTGPGRVQVAAMNLTVDASESISGEIERDGNRGTIWLRGDVDARGEEASFLGPALDLFFRRNDSGDSVLEGRSPGPSHIEWNDPEGRLVVVDTEGEADWIVIGEELLVPQARKASVKIEGEGGFQASAGLLQDFVRSTRSFEGSEGVEYVTGEGVARADRVVAKGPEEAVFFGTSEAPASFELGAELESGFDQGSLKARRVERGRDTVTAEGDVVLELDGADGEHTLECAWLQLSSTRLSADAPDDVPHPFVAHARGVKRADFAGDFGAGKVGAREIVLRGTFLPKGAEPPGEGAGTRPGDGAAGGSGAQDEEAAQAPGPQEPLGRSGRTQLEAVEARGAVQVEFHGESEISGEGASFEWNPDGGGRLVGGRGQRAQARGRISAGERAYRISAEWIEFGEGFMNARWPRLHLDEALPDPREPGEDLLIGASAEWMGADEDGILFSGLAHLVGRLSSGEDWRLDSGALHVELAREESGEPGPVGALESIVAWDGFEVQVGRELLAQGDVLEADFRVLRMEGAPARMQFLGFVLESSHIEYDVTKTLVKTEQGRATGLPGSGYEGWTLEYESLEPHDALDSTILVVRNPSVRDDSGQEMRAAWALFWVDRDRWQQRTQDLVGPLEQDPELRAERLGRDPEPIVQPEEEEGGVRTIFGKLRTGAVAQVLTETYLEGDVEFLRDGERYARMDAAYIDLIDGHGWLQNAEVYWDIDISDSPTRLVARAQWMRHSADGSLQADRATVTSCDFAEPHMFIQTRDLRFTPVDDQPGVFRVKIKSNSLRFDNGFGIPLPPLSYKSDSKGRPYFGNFSFGDSARFGSFVSGTFNAGLGVAGSAVASMVGESKEDVDGRVRYRASWLGSRGLLLGTGLEASVPDKFWMNLYVDGVNDSGEDLGLVRVPTDDRPDYRYYIRGRARYLLTEREWFDFALNIQSDAGVQSEFYEGQFVFYEERDNYVHWRKAENETFKSMIAAGRVNDFRNYLAKLPNALIYGGKAPVGDVSGLPLLYSNDSQVGLLRRLPGTQPQSPFDPDFDNGIGDLTILRADTTHKLEMPFALEQGSWRLSPFTSVRGTFWSEDTSQNDAAARADLYAGVQASTHFDRTPSKGLASAFTPTIGVRGDVVNVSNENDPIPIDEVEYVPREGFFVDLGLRTQLGIVGKDQRLTIDLRSTHGSEVDVGQSGWLPVQVLAQLDARIGNMPIIFVHDGRYDPDDDLTLYSRSTMGFVPTPDLGIQFGLHTGRDNTLERVYDAGTVGASWRMTEKWEIEALNTVNFISSGRLAAQVVLRRYGHDFVFDIQVAQRAAEGTFIGFSIRPLLGFRSRRLGQIERWLDYDG